MIVAAASLALVVLMDARAVASMKSTSKAEAAGSSPSPTPERDQYATYSVLTLGKSAAVTLTRPQLAWLRKIHGSRSYHGAWKHLRFSLAPTHGIVPLVVYDDRDTNIVGAGAHILGAPCNILFDPFRRGVFGAPPDASCEAPTPRPVVRHAASDAASRSPGGPTGASTRQPAAGCGAAPVAHLQPVTSRNAAVIVAT